MHRHDVAGEVPLVLLAFPAAAPLAAVRARRGVAELRPEGAEPAEASLKTWAEPIGAVDSEGTKGVKFEPYT